MSDQAPNTELDQLFEEFNTLSEALIHVQQRISAIHSVLVHRPNPLLEVELDGLRAERDHQMLKWASIALAWRLEGGRIALEDPSVASAPPAEVTPPPARIEEPVDLSILDDMVLGPGWTHSAPAIDPGFDVDGAQAVPVRLGPPQEGLNNDELLAEAAALDSELRRIREWIEYPRAIQRALTGMIACRMRRLQEETPPAVRVVLQLQLKKGFARLTQFSNQQQPGWVTGLSRQHRPESGSWLSDAKTWWETLHHELGGFVPDIQRDELNPEVALNELVGALSENRGAEAIRRAATRALNAGVSPEDARLTRLLGAHLGSLAGDKGLKRLRKAVRAFNSAGRTPAVASEEAAIPTDWPFFGRTRDRRAVMVGGETREVRRKQIEEAFGFSSVEWISGYDVRAVQHLAESIQNGGVEFVLLLARFISHKVTDILLPVCKASKVDWVMVRQGYGINQLRFAVERYLADKVKDEERYG